MSKQVYINGRIVDLSEDENQIAITYAVNDLAELKDRQASRTNQFKLPKTANNREILGYADDLNFSQRLQYKQLPARIVQNGIEILRGGVALIQGAGQFFEVQIVSGIRDFFDRIGDLKLKDIDLSDFDHVWNFQNVVGSQTNTFGYIWPVIDYGSISDFTPDVYVQELRPAVFVSTLLDRIISATGYSYGGKVFDDPLFKDEIVAFANDEFAHAGRYDEVGQRGFVRAEQSAAQQTNDQEMLISLTANEEDAEGRWSGTEYTMQSSVQVYLSISYDLTISRAVGWQLSSNEYRMVFQVFRNNAWQDISELRTTPPVGDQANATFPKLYLETRANLNSGEKVRAIYRLRYNNRTFATVSAGKIFIDPQPQKDTVYGQDVQLEVNLPDISQKDFLKDFLQRWALTIIPDPVSMNLDFRAFGELEQNKPLAKNWTDKITARQRDTKFVFGGYARINELNFKDDDALPKRFGQGRLLVGNEALPPNDELFSSPFAGSIEVVKAGFLKMAQIRKISDPAVKKFDVQVQPRLLFLRRVQNAGNVRLVDGTANATPDLLAVPHFNREGLPGMDYQNLIYRNYAFLESVLQNVRVVTAYAVLTDLDVAHLDFFIPIYDEVTQAYYYLNEITNYTAAAETKITLIRI